ncbi:disks large-associated protein 4-like isoform X1, partial [Clarias magur]
MDQSCLCSAGYGHMESQAVEALDLPAPTCFRSRSHSYLRAIQAGCSQEDDSDSDEPPLNTDSNTSTRTKTPPPVPPRSASKPYISVTVQSSTESAQDTYLEQRSEANSQSGRSNSTDSSTSSRTGSLAKAPLPLIPHIPVPIPVPVPLVPPIPIPIPLVPPIPVPVPSARVSSPPPPPPARETQTVGVGFTQDEPRAVVRRKLSSIGIQVDCVQPVLREEHTPTTKFQSIGVQVEDGRPLSRFSSMASRQETADAETQDRTDGKTTENSSIACSTQTLDSPMSAARAQKSCSTLTESVEAALDPSFLPPPPPSLQSVNGASEQPGAPAACLRDGHCFLRLLQAETGRMDAWCQQMEQESKDRHLSEEGRERSAAAHRSGPGGFLGSSAALHRGHQHEVRRAPPAQGQRLETSKEQQQQQK